MSSSSVTVTGADRLARTAAGAADRLANLAAVNARIASSILAAARPPVRTGRLRASGRAASSSTDATVTWDAPYAVFADRRRPFAAAALEARTPATVELVAAEVRGAVGSIRGA